MSIRKNVTNTFAEVFGDCRGAVCAFAPGRVNLIGEHTDYNGGHVLPCALTMGIYAVGRKRKDRRLRMYSIDQTGAGLAESDLDACLAVTDDAQDAKDWTAYVKGVMWAFAQEGIAMDCGLDIVVGGDLPAGSGLSSSAALEVAVAVLLSELYGFDTDPVKLALLGCRAENEYVGMNCGIMDQFASAMGSKDHAIYLDTNTLAHTYVPLVLANQTIVITNTNKKHSLASSAYNDRRRECAEALEVLRGAGSLTDDGNWNALCDLTPAQFDALKGALTDPVLLKRARHAVTENQRTIDACAALNAGDLAIFGKLMNASHRSLRDDYEVSCPELDVLAETAWTIDGVYGSRMTGGGFGGCTVSIVENDALGIFKTTLAAAYRKAFGIDCTFYTAAAGQGACVV